MNSITIARAFKMKFDNDNANIYFCYETEFIERDVETGGWFPLTTNVTIKVTLTVTNSTVQVKSLIIQLHNYFYLPQWYLNLESDR